MTFEPSRDLVERVLRRLFPWIEVKGDPWQQLRRANGPIALEDQPKREAWRWHCAPVDEWVAGRQDWRLSEIRVADSGGVAGGLANCDRGGA